MFHGDLTVRNADGEFGDNLCVEGMLSLEDSSILVTGGFYGGGITAVKKQDVENITYEELNLEGGKVLAERGVKGVIFAENYKLNVQSGILERSDAVSYTHLDVYKRQPFFFIQTGLRKLKIPKKKCLGNSA